MKDKKTITLVCILLIMIAFSSPLCISSDEEEKPKNLPPQVDIETDISTGIAPLAVSFKANAEDPDGFIDTYEWDFDDDSTSTKEKLIHTFYTPGSYEVQLKVKDNLGAEANDSITIKVSELIIPNEIPTAEASVEPNSALVNQEIDFIGSGEDSDGWIISFSWDFDGDGNFDWQSNTTGATKYAFNDSGEYNAIFRVMDNDLDVASDSVSITIQPIENDPPDAKISQPQNNAEFEVDEVIQFDGSESSDPDGDTLTYSWDFGDGNTPPEAKPTHSYSAEGNYTVELAVNDGHVEDTVSINIRIILIVNNPPVAEIVAPQQNDVFQVNSEVTFDGSNSSDPDGDIIFYYWDFGDGSFGSGVVTAHIYLVAGTYQVELRVDDGELSDTDNVRILITDEPANQPPEAVIDEPTNGENFTIDENVRFNGSSSSDPEGDSLDYIWDFGDDTEGYGMITHHKYSENGTYNVTLTVDDGQYTDTASIVIIIGPTVDVNTPPTAIISEPTILSTYETNRDVNCVGYLSFDPEDDPLTYDWDFGDGSPHATEMNTTHRYTTEGVYLILLTVSDGMNNDTDSVVISVSESTTNNSAPVAEIVAPSTGQQFSVDEVIAYDGSNSSDPDGDPLTYSWNFGDGTTGTGVNTTHKYSTPGFYTVILTVSDGELNDTDRVSIIVKIQFRSAESNADTNEPDTIIRTYIDHQNSIDAPNKYKKIQIQNLKLDPDMMLLLIKKEDLKFNSSFLSNKNFTY
jgi:PKD repeat protein